MSLMKIILWGIVIYFIYRFVFNIVVPVSKATSQMKDKIREMQDAQVRQQQQNNGPVYTQQTQQQTSGTNKEGEYIDFEEVKH